MYHARKGVAQLRATMISPPPTLARLVKLRKEIHRFYFFLSFIYIILYVTIIWQNLGGRKDGANAPLDSSVPRRTP